jgi:AcrR family transcriptional regulator
MNRRSAEDSRKKILDAALEVFSERGYQGTNMRTIAVRSGISVGGLYLYFENKETLYSTLMGRTLDDLSGELEEAVGKIVDPVAAFSAFIRLRLVYAKKNKELIIANNREPKLALSAALRTSFFERQRRIIEGILEKGIDSGDFADCDKKEAARIIMGVLRGFVFSLVVDADNLFSPEECSHLILNGLLTRKEDAPGKPLYSG